MTRHFLKCIEEPWEGDLDATPENWVYRESDKRAYAQNKYGELVISKGGLATFATSTA